jgi:hypothetical protein
MDHDEDVNSPPNHSAFGSAVELMQFIGQMRGPPASPPRRAARGGTQPNCEGRCRALGWQADRLQAVCRPARGGGGDGAGDGGDGHHPGLHHRGRR